MGEEKEAVERQNDTASDSPESFPGDSPLPSPPPPKQEIQIAKLAKWKGGGSFSTQFANNVQSLRTQQAEQVYPSSELPIQRVMPEQKVWAGANDHVNSSTCDFSPSAAMRKFF